MRADRLVATLLVLQRRGRVTAQQLADELEVSVKTARRDLEALSTSGIPVYAQPGRNGGWQLLGGARTDLSGLTADEARMLFQIAGPASEATPEAKAALRKLVAALPETFRDEAEAAAAATVLDPSGWGYPDRVRPPFLEVLRSAVVSRRQVRLVYVDRAGASSERVLHPLGVVEKGRAWYLVADTERGQRTFRVDRVSGVDVLDAPAVRPEGFDLATAWAGIVTVVESRRSSVLAVVRIPRRFLGALHGQFGSAARELDPPVDAPGDDDLIAVEVGASSEWIIAEQLAGWAGVAEVVSPPSVREKLAVIGERITAMYGVPAHD